MILYSAKSTIDAEGQSAYRITKFNDGEVESSYLTTGGTCDCPAGVRPTCRHRQMLSQMIAEGVINTHWFINWDSPGLGLVVDFEGTPKHQLDALLPDDSAAAAEEVDLSDPVGEALQGDLPQLSGLQEEMILMGFHQPELCKPTPATAAYPDLSDAAHATPAPASPKPWRRL